MTSPRARLGVLPAPSRRAPTRRAPSRSAPSRSALCGLVLCGLALTGCSEGAGSDGTAAPPLPAANGTDLSTCAAGQCEVRVGPGTVIPLNPSFQLAQLRVDSIGPDGVVVVVDLRGAVSASEVAEGCTVTTTAVAQSRSAGLRATCRPGQAFTARRLNVRVSAADDQAAVIRLTHH